MRIGKLAMFAVTALCASLLMAGEDAPKKKYKVLMVTQSRGFTHDAVKRTPQMPLAPAEKALTELGEKSGLFETECTQDASVITADKLKDIDIVFFYTTGALPISEENFKAFTEWLKTGKGFCGTHSATDTFGNFKPYYELIGGTFSGHPWNWGSKVKITNHDPEHGAVKSYAPEFEHVDEMYQFRNYDPKSVRVLLSLNMSKCDLKMPYHVPVCWVKEIGQGRVFYTSMGHGNPVWESKPFLDHLLGGIRWVLKLEPGSATPNPEVQDLENLKSWLAVAAQESGKNAAEAGEAFDKIKGDKAKVDAVRAKVGEYNAELDKQAQRRKELQGGIVEGLK